MKKYNNIPKTLTEKPNWVVWGVPGEPLKAPFQPQPLLRLDAVPAKSGIPTTWGRFESAKQCVERGLALGIGYEFDGRTSPASFGIYGVDLDHVIENGEITPEAMDIVKELNSYTEISPSGRGLHIFVCAEGANITRHRRQGGFVEIYSNARYFTVTGNVLGGYDHIASRSAVLQQIHDQYLLPEPPRAALSTALPAPTQDTIETLQRGLTKDPVLRACWHGERRSGDESASDQALMNKLAYWCNANIPAMVAAFLQSPYYTQKDEVHKRKCEREDYLPNTAAAALSTLRSTAEQDTARFNQAKKYRKEAR